MATKQDPSKVVQYWLNEIKAARKREDRYRKGGKEVFELYEADHEQETPFNILYSNTETLRPALYSAQPRPVVQRRFKDDDPIGKLASDASRRLLDYHLDTNKEDYETLNDAMGAAVLDALLPGRGVIALKYDADFTVIPEPRPPQDSDKDAVEGEPAEYAEKEQVCVESIVWNRFYIGYAKKWTKVPWIAYEFFLTKEEVAGKFGESLATKLTYHSSQDSDDDKDKRKKRGDDEEVGERKTALVYQIWDKVGGKKIRYISPNYLDGELRVDDDPLELTGFFNTPRPLMFVEKSCSLVPTAPYKMYKSQADELNRITRRIKKITEAVKARGVYDGALGGDLEKLFEKDDNALVPTETASSLAAEKGLQNAIAWIPLEVIITVLQQLYQAREACKQTIYEITGIADIMRGATNASETLGAQQIKNQWGTLRLKRMQNEVARYVRDLLRMTLEIAATKFDEETWAEMTGLPFVTTEQRLQLEAQAQAMTKMQIPGQPPTPQMQMLQKELEKPVWGQILELLKNDAMRAYRIDIETNSTIQPEAAEDQEAITKILTALGQTMQSFGPLVLQGVLPFDAAKNMLLFIARRYRFGDELEDSINAMQPPKPEDDGKEAEMQQKMMELDKKMAVKEIDHKKKETEMAIKETAMQAEHEDRKRKMDLDLQAMQLQLKEHQFGMQQTVEKGMFDVQKQQATQEIGTRQQLQEMKEKKFNTEAVVNKKTDTAMSKVEQAVKQVTALSESIAAVQEQAQQMQQVLANLVKVTSAKRIKRPIRGKDGRIERVEEEIEAVA